MRHQLGRRLPARSAFIRQRLRGQPRGEPRADLHDAPGAQAAKHRVQGVSVSALEEAVVDVVAAGIGGGREREARELIAVRGEALEQGELAGLVHVDAAKLGPARPCPRPEAARVGDRLVEMDRGDVDAQTLEEAEARLDRAPPRTRRSAPERAPAPGHAEVRPRAGVDLLAHAGLLEPGADGLEPAAGRLELGHVSDALDDANGPVGPAPRDRLGGGHRDQTVGGAVDQQRGCLDRLDHAPGALRREVRAHELTRRAQERRHGVAQVCAVPGQLDVRLEDLRVDPRGVDRAQAHRLVDQPLRPQPPGPLPRHDLAESRHDVRREQGDDDGVHGAPRDPGHRRVGQDQAGHLLAGDGRLEQGDPSAHRVPDDDRGLARDLLDEPVDQPPVAIGGRRALVQGREAEAGQVQRVDGADLREAGGDGEPVQERPAEPVHQHEGGAVGGALPRHVVDLAPDVGPPRFRNQSTPGHGAQATAPGRSSRAGTLGR